MLKERKMLPQQWLRRSRLLQVAVIIAFWILGEQLGRWLMLPIPGGVIGLFILLLLLYTKVIRVESLTAGAEWFLAEMLLFFIPAVPAVLNHPEFLGWLGFKIFFIILTGTILVMASVALLVDICFRHLEKPSGTEHSS